MEDKWQVMADRVINLSYDIQKGIKPQSDTVARNYIKRAWHIALARKNHALASIIHHCLHTAWPDEITNSLKKAA